MKRTYCFTLPIGMVLIVLFLLTACTFTPDEVPVTFVQKPSDIPPSLPIRVTPDIDTLKVCESIKLEFDLSSVVNSVHWMEFYLDNELLYQLQYDFSLTVPFTLEAEQYKEGLHQLDIKVFTSSRSGSLADKLKGEGYLYQLSCPVVIDFTPPRQLKIDTIQMLKNGDLFIKWEKFDHPSFQNYQLIRLSFFENKEEYVAEFTNPDSIVFIDRKYVEGEKFYYQIVLNGLRGEGQYFSEFAGKLTLSSPIGNQVTVSWNPPKNIGQLDFYRLFQEQYSTHYSEVHLPSSDTSYTYKIPFGDKTRISLQFIPKTNTTSFSYDNLKMITDSIEFGDQIPVFRNIVFIPGTTKSLMRRGRYMLLFDHQERQVIDSMYCSEDTYLMMAVSPDGKKVATVSDTEVTLWEIDGFKKIGSVENSQMNFSMPSYIELAIYNNLQISVTKVGQTFVLYDFNKKSILFELDKDVQFAIFDDINNRLLVKTVYDKTYYKYYRVENNQFELISETEYPWPLWGHNIYFSDNKYNQIIIVEGTSVQVRKRDDFSLINSFELPQSGELMSYDNIYNCLLIVNDASMNGNHSVLQLPEGNSIDTLYLSRWNVILFGDYLIGRNGRQIERKNL